MTCTINNFYYSCCTSSCECSGSSDGCWTSGSEGCETFAAAIFKSNVITSSVSYVRSDVYGRLELVTSGSNGANGITTIVNAPRVDLPNANSTLSVLSASHFWLEPNTLSAVRTGSLSTMGAVPRDHISVYICDINFMYVLNNTGPASGSIFSSSIGGAVKRCVADCVFDGTNWALGSITRLN